jgi:hypothetical protein
LCRRCANPAPFHIKGLSISGWGLQRLIDAEINPLGILSDTLHLFILTSLVTGFLLHGDFHGCKVATLPAVHTFFPGWKKSTVRREQTVLSSKCLLRSKRSFKKLFSLPFPSTLLFSLFSTKMAGELHGLDDFIKVSLLGWGRGKASSQVGRLYIESFPLPHDIAGSADTMCVPCSNPRHSAGDLDCAPLLRTHVLAGIDPRDTPRHPVSSPCHYENSASRAHSFRETQKFCHNDWISIVRCKRLTQIPFLLQPVTRQSYSTSLTSFWFLLTIKLVTRGKLYLVLHRGTVCMWKCAGKHLKFYTQIPVCTLRNWMD